MVDSGPVPRKRVTASGVECSVRALILVTVAAASAFRSGTVLFPVRSPRFKVLSGSAYWIVLTLVASALPVRLPQGTCRPQLRAHHRN